MSISPILVTVAANKSSSLGQKLYPCNRNDKQENECTGCDSSSTATTPISRGENWRCRFNFGPKLMSHWCIPQIFRMSWTSQLGGANWQFRCRCDFGLFFDFFLLLLVLWRRRGSESYSAAGLRVREDWDYEERRRRGKKKNKKREGKGRVIKHNVKTAPFGFIIFL